MAQHDHINNERILRLAGSSTVYLGDLQGEMRTVANINFAARYPDAAAAAAEVERQRQHGRNFEAIPAPSRAGVAVAGFGTRRTPAAASF